MHDKSGVTIQESCKDKRFKAVYGYCIVHQGICYCGLGLLQVCSGLAWLAIECQCGSTPMV